VCIRSAERWAQLGASLIFLGDDPFRLTAAGPVLEIFRTRHAKAPFRDLLWVSYVAEEVVRFPPWIKLVTALLRETRGMTGLLDAQP
jgi:hypothetical protein